ncbi:hypothetical protein PQU92_07685 [Asticcacaulis sp. BYS171W]|uniref:ABC transporter substrate-binding protein n=1 Tax=Asticcacaulis aquaticus TaxID=2984212 RepID=A0ABT5HT37_9CAUL|nr:hypothetical protein [Asticcacaulis aquaticus]MDC7683154.1 hypothetical protein [Asticcacaulis aquaticus]
MRKPLPSPTSASPRRPNACAVAGGFGLCLLLLIANGLAPRPGKSVAVLTLPLSSVAETGLVVARAGGQFEDAALSGRIIVARSDDPHFIDRLYTQGAVLVFNPGILAGCRPL